MHLVETRAVISLEVSITFGQVDQKLLEGGKDEIVGIKACYFMRILLVMVSDYCSKGWIFVPTSGKPGKSRVWKGSRSWTTEKTNIIIL